MLDYVGRVCATNDKARDLAEENRGEEGQGSNSSRSRGTKDVGVCDSQKFIKLNRHREREREPVTQKDKERDRRAAAGNWNCLT